MGYYVEPQHYETAKRNGISEKNVNNRVYEKNWSIERAVTQPVMKRSDHEWDAWKDVAKVSKNTYTQRVSKLGWDKERAALTPSYKNKKFKRNEERFFTDDQERIMRKNGIARQTAYMRVHKLGWTKEDAVTVPTMSKEESLKRARENSVSFIFGREWDKYRYLRR